MHVSLLDITGLNLFQGNVYLTIKGFQTRNKGY
jgi:hypothetical protein